MIVYFCKRILYGIPVLVAVATLTFGIMHMVPGGPFDTEKKLPPEIIANIEAKYHLNEPLVTQYFLYMKQVFQGDLGPSYKYIGRDVSDIIAETFPVSITLGLCAVLVILGLGIPGGDHTGYYSQDGDYPVFHVTAITHRKDPVYLTTIVGIPPQEDYYLGLGIPGGIIAAYWHNTAIDRSCVLLATLGISVPSFVLGTILVWVFSHKLHWLPPALWEGPRHVLMPAFALGAGFAGYIARLTRTTVLDVLASDYIRTARAKGLSEPVVLLKHALKNSIYPVVSVMGPLVAGLVTGSFVIEFIFSIPGMGSFFITAVTNRDYPLIMGVTLVYAVLIVLANIMVDMMYAWLDPRVSLGK